MIERVKYFEPGARVWVHVKDGAKRKGVVDARQGGVYRVRLESDDEVGLWRSDQVTARVKT